MPVYKAAVAEIENFAVVHANGSDEPNRVLLVVDQPVLKEVLSLVLNHGVFVSRTATTVVGVAAVLREWQPQLAVIDTDLAVGKLVSALTSATSTTKRIPVIALTRRGDLQTKLDAFESGADDILTLPFSPEELVARALAIMRRTYGVSLHFEPRVQIGGLEIDMLNRRVHEGPAELHLTPIELSLLYLLAANSGKALTRHQILESVWGRDYVGDANVVDRHVRSLRIKLENEPLHSYIQTVPRHGYRFTARPEIDAILKRPA